jgi:hypothetical protein
MCKGPQRIWGGALAEAKQFVAQGGAGMAEDHGRRVLCRGCNFVTVQNVSITTTGSRGYDNGHRYGQEALSAGCWGHWHGA